MGAPPLGVGQSLPCGDLVLDRKTTWVSAKGFFSNDVNTLLGHWFRVYDLCSFLRPK